MVCWCVGRPLRWWCLWWPLHMWVRISLIYPGWGTMPPFVARQQLWAIVINPTLYSLYLTGCAVAVKRCKPCLSVGHTTKTNPLWKRSSPSWSCWHLDCPRLRATNGTACYLLSEVCQLFNRIIAISQSVAMVMCVQSVEIGTQQVHVLKLWPNHFANISWAWAEDKPSSW